MVPEDEVSNTLTSNHHTVNDGSICCHSAAPTVDNSSLFPKQLELPQFDGKDTLSWVTRAEHYFEMNGTHDDLKVSMAPTCTQGSMLHWLLCLCQHMPPACQWSPGHNSIWAAVKLWIWYDGKPLQGLEAIKPTRSIDEFIARGSHANIPDLHYVGYFLNGLREHICIRLQSHEITVLG